MISLHNVITLILGEALLKTAFPVLVKAGLSTGMVTAKTFNNP